MPEPVVNPEMLSAGQAVSGKAKPPLNPKFAIAIPDNATLSSNNDSLLVGTDSDKALVNQSSKGAQSRSMSPKLFAKVAFNKPETDIF